MPEIAEIFRDHHKEYFRRNNAPPEVIRTIFDIEKCCTPAMGHSILCTCPDCGHLEIRYRSCGNRNCPQCGGHKITEWVEKRLTERLPVDYFMATFTLPREFNFLFRQHPGEAVKTFMKCVSDSLLEMGKSKLHGMVGFMMVYRITAMRSVVGGQKGLAISQTARFPVLRSSVDEAIQGKIQCGDLAASRRGQNPAECFSQ